jgi:hypothetical protein
VIGAYLTVISINLINGASTVTRLTGLLCLVQ